MVTQLVLCFEGIHDAQIMKQYPISKKPKQDVLPPLLHLLRCIELSPQPCTVQLEIVFKEAGLKHLCALELDFKLPVKEPVATVKLTKREIEIGSYIVHGLSCNVIADKLHISFETVRNHRKNLYRKLNIKHVTELSQCMPELDCFGAYRA